MKTYNIQINNKVVSTHEKQLDAYNAYSSLILLMPSSNIQVIEGVKEERGEQR